MVNHRIVAQMEIEEGKKNKPYRDDSQKLGFEGKPGKLTIGIGRNLDDVGLSDEEIYFLFENDWNRSKAALNKRLPWTASLDEVRQAVLIDMTFNMGIDTLLQFAQTLAFIMAQRYEDAAKAMLKSLWANQVGSRAYKLAEQMRTGVWQ
jgi:lysozyme